VGVWDLTNQAVPLCMDPEVETYFEEGNWELENDSGNKVA